MKRTVAIAIFLTCLFASAPADARPLGQNIALVGIGGLAIVAGAVVAGPTMVLAATALITCGVVAAGIGVADEIYKACAKQPVKSSMALEEDTKLRHDADDAMRDYERKKREWQDELQKEAEASSKKKRKTFFIKSAEAGELWQENMPSLEPLQPIEQFIAENSVKKNDDTVKTRTREERRSELKDRKQENIPSNIMTDKGQRRDADGISAQQRDADETSMTGVRGWCHCWEQTPPGYDSLLQVGNGNLNDPEHFEEGKGDYSYRICTNCGRCYTNRKIGDKGEADIIDLRIHEKYHEQAGSSISVQQFQEMLRKAEDKLLAIPDGKIVIHGTCNCKRPDPVSVALVVNEKIFVCCFCGRVRLPDKNGNIPTGPTNWRLMMGPNKPFPGFKD